MSYQVLIIKQGSGSSSIVSTSSTGNMEFLLRKDLGISMFEDCAIFYSKDYKNIFGKKAKNSSQLKQLSSIVKITYKGKSIYRKYISIPGICESQIALSAKSLTLLGIDFSKKITNDEVDVKRVNIMGWLKYYLYHPDTAIRITVIWSIISIVIALISLVITLIK